MYTFVEPYQTAHTEVYHMQNILQWSGLKDIWKIRHRRTFKIANVCLLLSHILYLRQQ